jgi:chaperonin GroEL (HSP60 family)
MDQSSEEFERQEREYIRAKEKEEKWAKLLNDFSDLVNTGYNYSEYAKGFQNAFSRQHRTLQQNMFRVMLQQIEHMATDEYRTDGRNEDSKEVAKAIVESFAKAKEDIARDSKPSQWLGTV